MNDLLDLDALLGESVDLANARKAAKAGRKLTQEQAEILQANQLAEEMEQWQPKAVFAHIVDTTCSCGHNFPDFRGWYSLEERKVGNGRRLVRRDDHEGLPAMLYTTELSCSWCSECAGKELEQATSYDCELLEELEGTPSYECTEEVEEEEVLEERPEDAFIADLEQGLDDAAI